MYLLILSQITQNWNYFHTMKHLLQSLDNIYTYYTIVADKLSYNERQKDNRYTNPWVVEM